MHLNVDLHFHFMTVTVQEYPGWTQIRLGRKYAWFFWGHLSGQTYFPGFCIILILNGTLPCCCSSQVCFPDKTGHLYSWVDKLVGLDVKLLGTWRLVWFLVGAPGYMYLVIGLGCQSGAVVRSMFEIKISAGHLWGCGFDSRSNPFLMW
jgi:hypothetical protein